LVLLVGGGYVIEEITKFFKANRVLILTIIGICAVCAIVCFIIRIFARNKGLKTFLTILTSIGLICGVLYIGPAKMTDTFNVVKQKLTFQKKNDTQTEKINGKYAYIITDALNVRAEPSVDSEIVGRLTKDNRIEVSGNSGQWRKIKSANIEGYVDSDFLRYE
jgi:hypothetical protein